MSIIKNDLGIVVPIRERRSTFGTFSANGHELVLQTNGDESALIVIQNNNFVGTIEFSGCADVAETAFFTVAAYPYSPGWNSGATVPVAGQPIISFAIAAAMVTAVFAVPIGQLRKLRVRVTAFTSGVCAVNICTDTNRSLNTAIEAKPSTLCVTATGAVSAAVTATLPAVPGFRHIIDFIQVTRSATAALTASATPVLVTTTNTPGTPALTFGSDAAGIGIDKDVKLDFGSTGMASPTINTSTTVVAPVYTGVIWRITVGYRLGL